jgi:hypothetical protein
VTHRNRGRDGLWTRRAEINVITSHVSEEVLPETPPLSTTLAGEARSTRPPIVRGEPDGRRAGARSFDVLTATWRAAGRPLLTLGA